ncbi:hypothetical protein GXP67_33260 [Rhodocytophaga rosea]|uniref:Uncharacterized protein n=1 Tax=Rhodocytophaga rosea TaxID=2704465 RepID=A0A6C0GTF7_9BACT|nr:hypothetical protein [Rhodocytophaga rosea]QHT71177.1 hypothetical protein GXP67_33260 [Rhodocytophaga rosea]
MQDCNPELISEQISDFQYEVLLINIIYALVNSLSLFALGFIFNKMFVDAATTNETFFRFLEVAAALFAPFLSVVSQGFHYPKFRKLNSLDELLWKTSLTDAEAEIMYDK